MRLAIGDRVQTPDGDGTIVGWTERHDRFYRPPLRFVWVNVELDRRGMDVRCYHRDAIEPFSSKAENQAEGLASERRMEEKHGQP